MGFEVEMGKCTECDRGPRLTVQSGIVDGAICEECIADCIDGSIIKQKVEREFNRRYLKPKKARGG